MISANSNVRAFSYMLNNSTNIIIMSLCIFNLIAKAHERVLLYMHVLTCVCITHTYTDVYCDTHTEMHARAHTQLIHKLQVHMYSVYIYTSLSMTYDNSFVHCSNHTSTTCGINDTVHSISNFTQVSITFKAMSANLSSVCTCTFHHPILAAFYSQSR